MQITGGSDPGSGNLIENNGGHGVLVDPGNGAAISGAGYGNNTVGNTILLNKGAGVRVITGNDNRISRNSIFGNGALGIDIDTAGENANTNCNSSNSTCHGWNGHHQRHRSARPPLPPQAPRP